MKGQEPVSAAVDDGYGYGPYTVEDLHGLPDEGKAHELVDGRLIELSPSTRHDYLAKVLARIVERAAEDSGTNSYVQAPMEISTLSGARKPDVAVMSAAAARNARDLGLSLYPGDDVQLAIEIVSRGSGSEREDRGRKAIEYARSGIDQYRLVDFDPHPRIQIRRLSGGVYGDPIILEETDVLEVSDPFPISFPLSRSADFS
ncbi:Uma2 family endonuclease [Nocardia sp. CA-151230]|uniref:Uma2 family endonuclease n=1 Tax=Nocardia sp. CA-151230 TaxID=3239982 RepID=UPI003D9311F6